jgi:hypothetical protein
MSKITAIYEDIIKLEEELKFCHNDTEKAIIIEKIDKLEKELEKNSSSV